MEVRNLRAVDVAEKSAGIGESLSLVDSEVAYGVIIAVKVAVERNFSSCADSCKVARERNVIGEFEIFTVVAVTPAEITAINVFCELFQVRLTADSVRVVFSTVAAAECEALKVKYKRYQNNHLLCRLIGQ